MSGPARDPTPPVRTAIGTPGPGVERDVGGALHTERRGPTADEVWDAARGPGRVKVGFFSFTEITDPAEHRSYNEWHQLDHQPEQFRVPGIVFGQRWVATPACRAARAVDLAPLDVVHYLTLYLMTEPVEETLGAFAALGAELHALGRFHQHRRAVLSGPTAVAGAWAAPRVHVSAAVVPYRPHRGVYVVVHDPGAAPGGGVPGSSTPVGDRGQVDEVGAGDDGDDLDHVLRRTPGVAGVWSFRPGSFPGRWRMGDRAVTVGFLDGDPLAVAAALRPEIGARAAATSGGPRLVQAGPWETITPWRWDWFDAPEAGARPA